MYSYCIVPIFCIEKISKEVCTVQFIQFSLIVTLKFKLGPEPGPDDGQIPRLRAAPAPKP